MISTYQPDSVPSPVLWRGIPRFMETVPEGPPYQTVPRNGPPLRPPYYNSFSSPWGDGYCLRSFNPGRHRGLPLRFHNSLQENPEGKPEWTQ